MEITVKHPSRDQAILIANTLVEVAIVHGREIMENRSKRAIQALDDEIESQAILVQEDQNELTAYVKENGVPSTSSDGLNHHDSIELSLKQHHYHQLIESHEQSKLMLREMKIKQEEIRILLKTPRSPVTIHQYAK